MVDWLREEEEVRALVRLSALRAFVELGDKEVSALALADKIANGFPFFAPFNKADYLAELGSLKKALIKSDNCAV